MTWSLGFKALGKDYLPDWLIRMGIRRLHRSRLHQEAHDGVESQQEALRKLVHELGRSPIAVDTDKANEQHYELPPEFFRLVLGRRLKYSSGLWPDGVSSLDESEDAMLRLYEDWRVDGKHYARTAEAWLTNMDRNADAVRSVLRQTYGRDEETKWWVFWRVFFMACAELWGFKNGQE